MICPVHDCGSKNDMNLAGERVGHGLLRGEVVIKTPVVPSRVSSTGTISGWETVSSRAQHGDSGIFLQISGKFVRGLVFLLTMSVSTLA